MDINPAQESERTGRWEPRVERDRLSEHVDRLLFGRGMHANGRLIAEFVCCGRAVVEVPTALIAGLPPGPDMQGVEADLTCAVCKNGWAIRLTPKGVKA
jgi:hypothetical protein